VSISLVSLMLSPFTLYTWTTFWPPPEAHAVFPFGEKTTP
jgi:hypothetical protein